ncbi:hypothetical protein Glove_346g202 [Diversispora epigaea]|uniref:Uncharacterized protein n=1 Tax=Diversispora epigaea TaxID=1348612 RepID=A0A397HKF5_9GLOM|nr:hypothetical protein Glove_346g202 [Diversispora epigaea]
MSWRNDIEIVVAIDFGTKYLDAPCVASEPDFVIEKQNNKHLENIGPNNGFGETQIAVDILAGGGNENIRSTGEYTDIMGSSSKNGLKADFNFAELDGRRKELTALVKIRQKLLQ